MGKSLKKLVVAVIATAMLLGTVVMMGCAVTNKLQADLDALQTAIIYVRDNTPSDLEAELERLQVEIDVFRNRASSRLTSAQKEQLNELERKVHKMRNEQNDFVLVMLVENPIVRRDEHINVTAELKNNSGQDHEITADRLFGIVIPNWCFFEGSDPIDPPMFETIPFAKESIISNHFIVLKLAVLELIV